MRFVLFTILSMIACTAESQAVYDSLTNVPPTKISCLYGQTATIVELNELYPSMEWANKLTNTSIINKQYSIVKAENDKSRSQVWVSLASKTDTIYYRLTSTNMERPPFLVQGFYEKQKELYLDQSLKLKIDYDYTETKSGKVKTFTTADNFTCTQLSIINNTGELVPSYILSTPNGETIAVPLKGFETTATNTIDRFTIL